MIVHFKTLNTSLLKNARVSKIKLLNKLFKVSLETVTSQTEISKIEATIEKIKECIGKTKEEFLSEKESEKIYIKLFGSKYFRSIKY